MILIGFPATLHLISSTSIVTYPAINNVCAHLLLVYPGDRMGSFDNFFNLIQYKLNLF